MSNKRETRGLGDRRRQRDRRGRGGGTGGGWLDRGGFRGAARDALGACGGLISPKTAARPRPSRSTSATRKASNKAAEQIVAKHAGSIFWSTAPAINVPKRSWADMELEGWDKLVRNQSQRRAVLHARGAADHAQAEGRLHHQRRVLGRPPRPRKCRARPTPRPSMRCRR